MDNFKKIYLSRKGYLTAHFPKFVKLSEEHTEND